MAAGDIANAWITPKRVRLVLFGLLVFSLVTFGSLATAPLWSNAAPGRHIAQDYESFWASSWLLHHATPQAVYDAARHEAVQDRFTAGGAGQHRAHEGFFYPPPYLLLCWPLALLPFGWSAGMWLAGGVLLYLGMVARRQKMAGLAFPFVMLNGLYGQNGFLSAALLGGVAMERAPFRAGLCLGLLICKPQLGLLAPVYLLAGGRWRMLAGAIVGAAVLAAMSTMVFGTAVWVAWWHHAPIARLVFEQGRMGFDKMASIFAIARVLGAPVNAAYAVQAVATIIATSLTAIAARQRDRTLGMALFVACVPIATPFIMDYDLVLLALPALLLLQRAETAPLPWDRLCTLLVFAAPVLLKFAAGGWEFPFMALEAPAMALLLARHLTRPPIA